MTAPELKPCPFCGGPVGIERGETARAIVCIAPSTCHDSGLLVGFAPEDEAEAIAAWNTRADLIPAALAVPEVAELIGAYEDIIDYGPLVFAKKPQWERLKAAKDKIAALRGEGGNG